jgi:hypothetical protein
MENNMVENKPQFDVLLGGTQTLPLEFSVGRFASARAQEIAALTQAIGECSVTVPELYRS